MQEPSPTAEQQPDDPADEVLQRILAAPAAALDRELEQACRDRPELAEVLRRRVAALRRVGALAPAATGVPGRLGRFRIAERIGGGGMGVVHRAVEEPLGREVALKLLRPELLWFAGSRERFRREASAIAALQHPGIVPMHAFGEEQGVPYCAMELVRGRNVADLLAAVRGRAASTLASSDLGQRSGSHVLACFQIALQAARALQHAHARGVVHRDVKPSNVMIADDGRVLLIDFGLARLANEASMTRTGTQPGSLAYMSPEQVRGDDVDERTDVFSLGVTLYELLTLESPFLAGTEEATRRRILGGAVRLIRQANPRVPADAEAVVATAMAPEPERRYRTMAAFASDLQAFLERRPVAARAPGPLLRMRRLAQRRPALATGVALGLLLLVGGPIVLLLQERAARRAIELEAGRARVAETRSAREAATATRVVQFLQELFYEVEPARARGEKVLARTVLDRGVARIREELRDEPEVRAALLEAMGAVYQNLGLFADSLPLLQECLALREQGAGSDPRATRRILVLLSNHASANGRWAEQEQLLRRVLASLPPPADNESAADLQSALGGAVWRQGRLQEGETLLQDAVALLRRHHPEGGEPLARALQAYAVFLQDRIDPSAAAPVFAESLAAYAQVLPEDHPRRLSAQRNQATNLIDAGRSDEAERILRQMVAVSRRTLDPGHPLLAEGEAQLALVLLLRGRLGEAMACLESAQASHRASYAPPHHSLARLLNLECSIALELGDSARAERAGAEAVAMYELLHPEGDVDHALALSNLCRARTMLGDLQAAIDLGRRSIAMQERHGHMKSIHNRLAKAHLAYALAQRGELAEAEVLARDAAAMDGPKENTRHVTAFLAEVLLLGGKTEDASRVIAPLGAEIDGPDLTMAMRGWIQFLRGWAANASGDAALAESFLRDSLSVREAYAGRDHPLVALTLTELAVARARQRDIGEAATLLERAVAIQGAAFAADNRFRVLPLLNLAAVRNLQGRHADGAALAVQCLRTLHENQRRGDPQASAAARVLATAADGLEHAAAILADAAPRVADLLPADDPGRQAFERARQLAR